jgi:hypothetical protein
VSESWASRARRALEEAGLSVSEERVRYRTLLGGVVSEHRVTGYSSDRLVKVSIYSREGEEGLRISVIAQGEASRQELADSLEELGASVDFSEGERMHALLKRVSPSDVYRVLKHILEA